MLYCECYIILCNVILFDTILCYLVLFDIMLFDIILCYVVLQTHIYLPECVPVCASVPRLIIVILHGTCQC
jgi:hypothetical protein